MSPVDPYGGTGPHGWERPAPTPPWRDREPEPEARTNGFSVSADRPAETRGGTQAGSGAVARDAGAAVRRRDASGYDRGGASRNSRPVRPGDAADGSGRFPSNGLHAPDGDPEHPTAQQEPVRDSPPGSEHPTAQLEPVRDDDDPAGQPPPRGRRRPGRRRATRAAARQRSSGKAGRNLPAAIGVGVALGLLIVVPLFLYPPAFLVVIAAALAVGCWEMTRAVGRAGVHPPLVPLVAGSVLTAGLAWFAGPDALTLGLVVTVLGALLWRLGDGLAGFRRDAVGATLIAVYVPFLGGFAALMAALDDGPQRVLVTLVAVVLSDTGGYAAGANFGRHPMAPTISPKKSWEGLAGSLGAAAFGSALLIWLLLDVAPWWGALFGVAVSAAAVLGDLAESMIKRDLGVKDMSTLLPGHGGLMDRLDSVLFALPTAYLLLAIVVPAAG
ncbi:phosphatidate cytidylyltransferase [Salinispora arenicola]|uniref:phosphatidate cytidylyltransferase n=1 Tax=Salinispora arenicola TaxID=168697 RepID=UPI00207ADAC7|nr:phosphatidate cytidylyltransferase [Salinispora arenicola]MCN0179455.1 phosphatidate cytidylyltransferase [Salinispora arenicola]